MRRPDPFEVGCNDSHRGERDGELGQRERVECTARHIEQRQRLRDVGHCLGADRLVGYQQRGQLGDLRECVADRRGSGFGEAGCNACRTQGPGGMCCDPRERLGELECL